MNQTQPRLPSDLVLEQPEAYTLAWWAWRGWLYLPVAIFWGCAFAIWHATSMNAWHEAFALGWRAVLAGFIVVGTGRLLALASRKAQLPLPRERIAVIGSIVTGVVLGAIAVRWAEAYHEYLMEPYAHVMAFSDVIASLVRWTNYNLGHAPGWIVLILAAGGYELPGYLLEPRRRAERLHRERLAALRREKDAADARLTALQAQIEPHFLFNTLASVRSMIGAEPQRGIEMIDALADYLRFTLPRFRNESEVINATLAAQMELCARYLDLAKIRMGNRLTTEITAAPETAGLRFPPLLLMPLVENAVKHGAECKTGPISISVAARRVDADQSLEVSVEDTGPGFAEEVGSGVGLANVRAQLAHLFGARASLNVCERVSGGVRASITVPAEPL